MADDLATRILEKKSKPNMLIVQDPSDITDERSVVVMSSAKMEELDLFLGDYVLLKGEKKETVCIVTTNDSVNNNHVCMSKTVRNNLRVRIGDIVSIYDCPDIKYGSYVHILPITVEGSNENIIEVFLKPHFKECYRPLTMGDTFTVRASMRAVDFKVVATVPSPYCIVDPKTLIIVGQFKREN